MPPVLPRLSLEEPRLVRKHHEPVLFPTCPADESAVKYPVEEEFSVMSRGAD